MTVSQLIFELQKMPSDAEVVIMDADEGYDTLLKITNIRLTDDYIGLGGEYSCQYSDPSLGVL